MLVQTEKGRKAATMMERDEADDDRNDGEKADDQQTAQKIKPACRVLAKARRVWEL